MKKLFVLLFVLLFICVDSYAFMYDATGDLDPDSIAGDTVDDGLLDVAVLAGGGTAFNSTTIDATTWSDGANASNVWTFDVSGTNTTITFGGGTVDFSHNLSSVTYGSDGTVTDAEFLYINTLSSNAQTQLNAKEDTLTNEAGLYAALSDVTNFTQPGVIETITANWINTANPWADNEVADDITLTNLSQITNKAITTLSATNWRLFYSGAGAIPIELALGANGTVLTSNGAAAAPTFETAGTGDVTSVGDCTSGECYDGSSDGGTYIRLYDGDSNYGTISTPDISATTTWTFPSVSGTLLTLLSQDLAPALGGNLAVGANEIQSTGNIVLQLGDNAGTYSYKIEDSDSTTIFEVDSNGNLGVASIPTYFTDTEADFYGTILNPQGVYDNDATNHAVTFAVNIPAAFTITAIYVSCDADPTTEPTLTFKHKAAGVGYGSPTTIEAVTTTAGVASVTSGIDDATIPADTKLFITLSDPDDALNEITWQIKGDWD